MSSRFPTGVIAAVARYRSLDIEYAALKVVGRGLFLAVMLMVVFLFVFTLVTDRIAGLNEVLVPTVDVDPGVDLGALVRGSFTRTSGSVVSAVGALTLVVSASLTASALRQGTRRALLGDGSPPAHLREGGTVVIAVLAPLTVLTCWLLTLATSIRRSAWADLLGRELNDVVVNTGKAGLVLLQWLIIAGLVAIITRRVTGAWPRRGQWAIAALVGVIATIADYALLFTYVGALINPAVSAGIVLILSVLLWVNVVVRSYLGALCWMALGGRPTAANTAATV